MSATNDTDMLGGDARHDGRRRFAVYRLPRHWYIACSSKELTSRPIGRRILDTPIVLFRTPDGRPHALLDRCAHRNVPLSGGRMVDGCIECPYHGWRYDGDGACTLVPTLTQPPSGRGRRVPAFPCRESQEFVWVCPSVDAPPVGEIHTFRCADTPGYTTVRHRAHVVSTVHACAENILDVPHTAFLHKGLFRGGGKSRITAVVRRHGMCAEAEFVGEPRPKGLMARFLAPGGGELEHVDRFVMPSITEVEYRLGARTHFVTSTALTPIGDFELALHAVIAFRLPLPGTLVRPILSPLARIVLRQDIDMLRKQVETTRHFGGERFVSTEVDLLGPHIAYLMRRAERGDPPEEGPTLEKRVELEV